ncbi:unnamed protein product, partial [Porites evermanni]
QVPEPVALFPLNSTFGTKEIKSRVAAGDASGVTLAPGPDGVPGGSYEFSGSSNSFIEFSNSEGGPLDVRYSMTMLCWVYYNSKDGPLFNYRPSKPWAFVGATYDHSTGDAKLWVNGAVVQTLNIGAGLDLATQDSIRMGAIKNYDWWSFKGRIAQMQVYDKALTQEQIQTIQQQ